jgi:transposase-like protein
MNTRKKYPKEFKLDAVSLVLDQSYTRIEAAKSLDINSTMLGRWVKEHQRSSDGQVFRGNGKLTPEQAEIRITSSPRKQGEIRVYCPTQEDLAS